jgi:methylated-DNA-[protein]-cysteine S-methyltransferase
VYEATKRIPRGKVATYKFIANTIACNSPRAVGQALRVNPFAPEVPCHRVIASNLSIGGFFGEVSGEKISVKLALLAQEGVEFSEGKLKDPRQCLQGTV